MRRLCGLDDLLDAVRLRRLFREADQQKLLAPGLDRLDPYPDRNGAAVTVDPRTAKRDAGMLAGRPANRCPELCAQPVARHCQKIPAGLAHCYLQIAVDRPGVI